MRIFLLLCRCAASSANLSSSFLFLPSIIKKSNTLTKERRKSSHHLEVKDRQANSIYSRTTSQIIHLCTRHHITTYYNALTSSMIFHVEYKLAMYLIVYNMNHTIILWHLFSSRWNRTGGNKQKKECTQSKKDTKVEADFLDFLLHSIIACSTQIKRNSLCQKKGTAYLAFDDNLVSQTKYSLS